MQMLSWACALPQQSIQVKAPEIALPAFSIQPVIGTGKGKIENKNPGNRPFSVFRGFEFHH
jgi:hypothetical protein